MRLTRLVTTFERMSPPSEEDDVPNPVPASESWQLLEDDWGYTDTLLCSAVQLGVKELGRYRGRSRASSRWPPSRAPISLSPIPASSDDGSWSLTSEIISEEDDDASQPLMEELRSSTSSPSTLSIRWLPSLDGGEPLMEHVEANNSKSASRGPSNEPIHRPLARLRTAAVMKEERAPHSPPRSGDTPAARYAAARDSQREAELKRLSEIVEAQSTNAMAMGRRISALEGALTRSEDTLRYILAAVVGRNEPPAYTEDRGRRTDGKDERKEETEEDDGRQGCK